MSSTVSKCELPAPGVQQRSYAKTSLAGWLPFLDSPRTELEDHSSEVLKSNMQPAMETTVIR